jgi:hypothetical protein
MNLITPVNSLIKIYKPLRKIKTIKKQKSATEKLSAILIFNPSIYW